jgi:hypothetical protein
VTTIWVPNSTLDLVDNATGQKWCDAIQRQLALDVAPHWPVAGAFVLHYVGDSQTEKPAAGEGVIPIVRASSADGTLGSHWLDGANPRGEVGAQTCLDDNVSISSCLSHEIVEMAGDLWASLCFQVGSEIWADELSDRVENSDDSYTIDGILVENFSLPAAFLPDVGGPWDFRGKCTSNIVLPTGYQLKFNLQTGVWTQQTGTLARASKQRAAVSSRRASRILRAGHNPKALAIEVVG